MGDKVSAKQAMTKAGVPVRAGLERRAPDDEGDRRIARTIGYPVIIKAAGGGGGRGMRVVHTEAALLRSQRRAPRRRPPSATPTVYLEKLLEKPRHIEIQVLADEHKNAVTSASATARCSAATRRSSRRAPAPASDAGAARAHGRRCGRGLRAIGYRSAGTFEFLYEDGEFYFIEMNTRIQVEHPVTEMVTGIDLVQRADPVAAGERLRSPSRTSAARARHRVPHQRREHLRVISCNTCSSIIVSTHHPENVQLITMKVSAFSKMSKKCSLRK